TVGLTLGSPPAVTLSYNGKLRDRVGQDNNALTADGQLDGTFTLTLSGGTRTVTGLTLTNSVGGIWDTLPATGYWALGVASDLNTALYQNGTAAVNFVLADGASVILFPSDYVNSE